MEAAFFDLDKTLLPGSSLFPLAREMYRQHYFTLGDIARLAADQIRFRAIGAEQQGPMDRAKKATLEVVRGRQRDEVLDFGRSVADKEIVPRLYPQAVELMSRHKRAGRQVFIASSSPEDYLALLAERLGIDGVIGTRAEVVDGRYTGELEGPVVHGPEKAARVAALSVERGIDLPRSFAYSDSVNDLSLLELVGNPVAMNPDRHLLQIARRRGWQIIDLRLARRRTLLGSAVGAGAAAVGAAGYAAGYAMGRRSVGRRSIRQVLTT
ncbi:MAG: HAD-IB family hydrolase [Actinomycetota bacterium]|nr:HAD-IB family hydrolase [Actinomycetota bacterium]